MSTTTDANGIARRTAGSPQGGQFATRDNTEPREALTAGRPHASRVTVEAIRASQRTLERTARSITSSYRIDPENADDIVQDSWVHLLERAERHDDLADRLDEKAFLGLVARKYGNDYGNDARFGLRHEDFRARRMLRARLADLEAEGTHLNKTQIEQLAGQIRMSFPPGRRPKPDYYVEFSQLSLDAPVGGVDGEDTLGSILVAETEDEGDETEQAAARALHYLEVGDKSVADTRKQMWGILTSRNPGTPQPVIGCITRRAANRARDIVTQGGGVHALAMKWLDGHASKDEDAALFAPFGQLDASGRNKVVDAIDEFDSRAELTWRSALSAAADNSPQG